MDKFLDDLFSNPGSHILTAHETYKGRLISLNLGCHIIVFVLQIPQSQNRRITARTLRFSRQEY